MSCVGMSLLLLALAATVQVAAQSSEVTQCIPGYEWTLNSLNQTPCLVAAYLESVCTAQSIDVPILPPGNHYTGPNFANATTCICSTVTYSLISACGACQNMSFTSWSNWSLNCPSVTVTTFPKPIPTAVDVPSWAFLDITQTNNTFDPMAAQTSISQTSSASQPVNTTPVSSSSSKSNTGAIAGGVIGGVVLLVVVAFGVFWFFLRGHRRWKKQPHRSVDLDDGGVPVSPPPMEEYTSDRSGIAPIPSRYTFDPSDTSTFPGSPVTSAIYTNFGGRSSTDSIPYHSEHINRGYTGAAEI